jgi:hypothetical protein
MEGLVISFDDGDEVETAAGSNERCWITVSEVQRFVAWKHASLVDKPGQGRPDAWI